MGAARRLTIGFVALVHMVGGAQADELIMPYACTMSNGAPHIERAQDTVYQIRGPRAQMPFSSCRAETGTDCETMMIHKFIIDCGGERVGWSRVAAAARSLGVEIPSFLPKGYAPVSRLSARFVLPALSASTQQVTAVSTQDLVPFASVDARPSRSNETSLVKAEPAGWITVVDAAQADDGRGSPLKFAGGVSAIVVLMLLASAALGRRWPFPVALDGVADSDAARVLRRCAGLASAGWKKAASSFRDGYESWRAASEAESGGDFIDNTLALLHARVGEVELLVAALPPSLLLRDVLNSELDRLRERGIDLERRGRRAGLDKVRAVARSMLRDLDRIGRIAKGAAEPVVVTDHDRPEDSVPQTAADAYRVLGLNATAPAAAIKKIVDALRVTWHPDLATDEYDRRQREERIKQINAAWDLLREVRRAA